jgi:DNA-binding response OmpR family regulator
LGKHQKMPEASSIKVEETKLMHLANLAEVGMSVAAVAHEVRQPLSAAKISLQMMRENARDNGDLKKNLDDVLQQIGRIELLVDRTRSFLLPFTGKKKIDFGEVVEEALALMEWKENTGSRRVKTEIRIDSGCPLVTADRSMLEHLVSNLVNNARDAIASSSQGKVLVLVRKAAHGSGVELIVADNGEGIDSDIVQNIFEAFFTTKSASDGTGLGLYIVKRVAEDHGAQVQYLDGAQLEDLDINGMTTGFMVTFSVSQARSTAPPPLMKLGARRIGKKRALVVDDEDAVLQILGKVLEQMEFKCVLCTTGEDALLEMEAGTFDLLVTDKNLPGISGIEISQVVRNLYPVLPILVITGYASEESALEALNLGVSDYVLKPLDLNDFRKTVEKIMAKEVEKREMPIAMAPLRPTPDLVEKDDVAVNVLLIEENDGIRDLIGDALLGLGCVIAACTNMEEALGKIGSFSYEVIIARPGDLKGQGSRLIDAPGVLGAIAIMNRGGLDRTIEAIHLGARGVIAEPYDEASVEHDFRRSVTRMRKEENQHS